MATVTLPAPPIPTAPPVSTVLSFPIYRLSVKQYHEMTAAGILTPEDRVELLDGILVSKMAKHRPHTKGTRAVRAAFESLAIPNVYVDSQEPVTLSASVPEPDGMIVRGTEDDYDEQPTARDVPLVAEVSESSLDFDRTHKHRIYAAARIPVYWIVNLVDRVVEVYTVPSSSGPDAAYLQRRDYGPNDEVPVEIDGVEVGRISVRDLLP